MEKFSQLVTWVDGKAWGWGMILLLLGTHLFMTVRTGFIQRKTITKGIKLSVSKEPDADGEVSQFGALATALASTIGTGNIIGVGTAVALGGPGAVLWCWLTGVFGIATKYSESLIAVKYRVKTEDGRMQGGAMYALERGLHMRWLGLIFAVFAGFASFGIGCATQVNAIATVCNENLHINKAVVVIIIGVLTAVVIFGGIKSIARVCERLVPFMALFYVLGCIVILGINYDYIIPAITTICRLAFQPGAAAGGLVGSGIMLAMRYGVARGLFSNEAGSGSAPCAAAAAECDDPVKMGFVQALGVLIDTVVICSCTAFLMLLVPQEITEGLAGMDLLQTALQYHLGGFGVVFIAATLALFSFSTFLGVLYYARGNVAYLCGDNWWSQTVYKLIALAMLVIGGMQAYTVVWDLGDVGIGLMTIFNMIALVPMAKEALAALNDYEKRKKLQ